MTVNAGHFIAICALVSLAACGGEGPVADADGAKGDVLAGSISDDMVPLDTVRSQPPLADRSETGDGEAEVSDGTAAESSDASEN